MDRLNLGCGRDILEGWVNLDCIKLPGVDIVHDINQLPLPFDENSLDEILCSSILEHVEYIPLLKDLHRILRSGGRLIIIVPHFTSKYAYMDPTHRHFFSARTLSFFVSGHPSEYYFDFHFSTSELTCIYFSKRTVYLYNHLLEFFVNLNLRTQDFYEGSFLRIFPATDLKIVLVK